jgi:hypothetical protein
MCWMCENVFYMVRIGVVDVRNCRNTLSFAKAAGFIVMIWLYENQLLQHTWCAGRSCTSCTVRESSCI